MDFEPSQAVLGADDAESLFGTKTVGDWSTEEESKAAFDKACQECELFKIYKEVHGEYVQPRFLAEHKTARIDRILTPTKKLLDAGWKHGPIGVECKASGLKVGPVIQQALDYSRAVWTLPEPYSGFHIVVEWVFVWPMGKLFGPAASWMQQNRIGTAHGNKWSPLIFKADSTTAIEVTNDGKIHVANWLPSGRKHGSRGCSK